MRKGETISFDPVVDTRIPYDYYYYKNEKYPEEALPKSTATNPRHYSRWEIEPLEFIMANDLPFWMGNVLKYIMRYDQKDGLQDLYKARTYLDEKIKELEVE